jgi:hypothetical protein
MTEITSRQLLTRINHPHLDGNTVGIDADLPLTDKNLKKLTNLLAADVDLEGLEVLDENEVPLGTVPAGIVTRLAEEGGERDADGGRLEGPVVVDAPLYRCNQHKPPYLRLSSLGQAPRCRFCGKEMKRL